MSRNTYEPLNTRKAVAQDLWVVDGPLIRFGPRPLSMPFLRLRAVARARRRPQPLDTLGQIFLVAR